MVNATVQWKHGQREIAVEQGQWTGTVRKGQSDMQSRTWMM